MVLSVRPNFTRFYCNLAAAISNSEKQHLPQQFNVFTELKQLIKTGNLNHARQLFDQMPSRDLYTLNSHLASYLHKGDALFTWVLFHFMHRACYQFNSYTFTPVLGACLALLDSQLGLQTHVLMIKTGSEYETVTKTALMDMYSKCGQLGHSVLLFDEILNKDVVVWNTLLSSFIRHGLPMKALNAFESMRSERVGLSEFTLCSLLKACASLKAFLQGKQVHALVIVMGRDLVILGTALIDFYSNVGQIEEAMKLYNLTSARKDDVMCSSLISGCVQNRKYKEAFSLMSEMKPNVVVLTSALSACSENSDMWIGRQIHCVATRLMFTSDTQLCNVLLDMYSKCGKINIARSLFDEILGKDVVSWTSMINAYGCHGYGIESFELFKNMGNKNCGVLPNSVTFLTVLSACGHSGMVEEGQKCFVMAQEKFGLVPGPEHYACLIDILGRASLIEEVWRLFEDMVKNGVKRTAAVWVALLNSCRHNLDITRGEYAAKQLLDIEPYKAGNYVLISNFYATIGRWDSVDELRNMMSKNGLDKELGSSRVRAAQAG